MKTSPISLILDWENPKGIVIVWPETIYDDLLDFYNHFSDYIPVNIELIMLVKNENTGKTLLNKIPNCGKYFVFPELKIPFCKGFKNESFLRNPS